jgi:hypothetical protein
MRDHLFLASALVVFSYSCAKPRPLNTLYVGTGGTETASGGSSGGAASAAVGGTANGPNEPLLGGSDTGGQDAAGGTANGPSVTPTGGSATGGQVNEPNLPPGNAPAVSGLTIEPNPNSTISCFVNWTTDVASTSEVHFGIADYEYRIVDEAATTQHRVLVIGMTAQNDYRIKAVSRTTGGEGIAEGNFTTGALPEQVPVGTLTVNDPTAWQQGWTLTNIMHGTGSGNFSTASPSAMVMYDEVGNPVWYYVNGTTAESRGDVPAIFLDNGNVLIGAQQSEPPREVDLAGNIVWEGPAQSGGIGSGNPISHYADRLPNGNYLVLREYRSPQYNVTGALIEELDSSNQVVWSWNMFDHVEVPAGAQTDWCHGNSVTMDLEQDIFYLSCRWLGVFKVHRSGDQSVIWHMAATDGGMPGTMTFNPPASQMVDNHDPEFHDDGSMLIFDNDGWDGTISAVNPNRHSRVLEFLIDEAAQVANLLWEFPGNFDVDPWYYNDFYLPYWGDADRLANGNILITAGVRDATKQSRLFEVRRDDGRVVWEIALPADNGCFRAQRLSPPPKVQRLN